MQWWSTFVFSAVPAAFMTWDMATGTARGQRVSAMGCQFQDHFQQSSYWWSPWNELSLHFCFRFWLAVQDLKKQPLQDVARRVEEIWQEFLAPGAPSAINLDSHSYEITSQNVKDGGRYTFEDAQVCSSHQTFLSQDVHVSAPLPHSLNTHLRCRM